VGETAQPITGADFELQYISCLYSENQQRTVFDMDKPNSV
jgi:hypothetical protein